jgi:hypothetical protein
MADYKYDSREAQFLIGAFAERAHPSTAERKDAAPKLLQDFITLVKETGCFVGGHGNTIDVMVGTAAATVTYDQRTGDIFVAQQGGQPTPVQLVYDRGAKKLRSMQPDKFLVPVPGEPVPYRSALAELVYATITMMQAGPAQ